jgi:hypothetical protein
VGVRKASLFDVGGNRLHPFHQHPKACLTSLPASWSRVHHNEAC